MTRRSVLGAVAGVVSAVVVSALLAGPTVVAQTPSAMPAPSEMVMLTLVQLNPTTAPQWATLQQNEVAPASRKGGTPWRDVWATGIFGDVNERGIVTPITSLSQFDSPSPMTKALGQDGARALNEKLRPLETGRRTYLLRRVADLSYGTQPDKPQIGISTRITVAPGRTTDFEQVVKTDFVPALKKAGVGYYVISRVVYGGDTNMYFSLVLLDNFDELGKGHPAERVMGPQLAAFLRKQQGITTSVERNIIRYLPDLSFRGGAGS